MMSLKPQPDTISVHALMAGITDPRVRKDCKPLATHSRAATGEQARIRGGRIIDDGRYSYTYASGHSEEWPLTGLAPGQRNLPIHSLPGVSKYGTLRRKLGQHRHANSCLHSKRLDGINTEMLTELVARSVSDMRKKSV
jgi:hypothetical protein